MPLATFSLDPPTIDRIAALNALLGAEFGPGWRGGWKSVVVRYAIANLNEEALKLAISIDRQQAHLDKLLNK
jgi:hypothetical protein